MTNINSKKEIKDILTAMDNLTKDELALELDPGCCPEEDVCDCEIPFCCSVCLPQGFKYEDADTNIARFAITKCCIRKIKGICTVKQDAEICGQTVPVEADVLVTKVFGCINFAVAVEGILGDCGLELTNDGSGVWSGLGELTGVNKTFACCNGCVCIDKIVEVENIPTGDSCPMWGDEAELDCDELELTEFEVVDAECDPEDPTPTPPYACNECIKIRGKLKLTGFDPICP